MKKIIANILFFKQGRVLCFYKFLILSVLFLSFIISNVNNDRTNLLDISISVNFGLFRTTITYLFMSVAAFISLIFVLNRKLINNKGIVSLIIFYIFYQASSFVIAFIMGQNIDVGVTVRVLLPMLALPFLVKNFDFNLVVKYFLQKIRLFVYLGIIVGIIGKIVQGNMQFSDLLFISLFLLSFELFEKKRIKLTFFIIALAFMSGFNLSWLFTFLFLIILTVLYYIKHFNFRNIVILFIIFSLAFYLIVFSGFLERFNFLSFPPKERFSQSQLIHATGRTALWKKYIYQYDGNALEFLFGHGSGYIYTISYNGATYAVGHLHNIFFDEFYKRGIVGLLLLLSIILICLKARAPTYLKVFFMLFLIYGQAELIIFMGVKGIVFWMVVGMLNKRSYENK